ncbi:MAG: M1 family metallopeptidase, partial [Myxococcales bacterium]|nr:M1 family metallopeptidase [Myxococcales bacterium]
QPEFKTPFEVSITAPQGHVVVANAPRATSEPDGQGRVKHRFKATRPLPTYLVGFAVGPFDVVASDGEAEVPLRIITAKGRRPLAAYALERSEELLGWMTDWFGRPYPFQKLDLLAIPDASVGAVENAGLITARETLLLLDGATADPQARLWAQLVLAHELAHAWMGNLVTPGWWNDLWLNEAFATWLAAKAVDAVDSELEADLEAVGRIHWVMAIDSREGAPPVRRPLPDGTGVERAFDRITYSKGAAVLRMAEAWLGEEALQKGVQAWLERFAYGNANTADLFAALDAAAERPVGSTLQAFLDQPGVPLVRAELKCPAGQAPFVHLERGRYQATGGDENDDAPWSVPVCLRAGRGKATERTCALLDGPSRDVTLAGACPDWIHPNADQAGYYRWTLPQPALVELVRDHRKRLTPAERIGLVGQLEAQLEAGLLPVDVYVTALTAIASDEHRIVVEHLVAALARLARVAVDPPQAPAYAALVRRLLTPHLTRLTETDDPDAPVDATLLRPRLEDALIWLGDDEGLTARAEALADRFLADPEAVEPEELVRALPVAARTGDVARWEALVGALGKEPDPVTRAALVTALGAFEDPVLLGRSLGLILDGTLMPDEYRAVTRAIAKPAARAAAWRWLELHYAALEERLGANATASLVTLAAGFCDQARKDEVARFFADRQGAPSVARDVDLVLQSVDRCARLSAALRPPLSAWLTAQGAP